MNLQNILRSVFASFILCAVIITLYYNTTNKPSIKLMEYAIKPYQTRETNGHVIEAEMIITKADTYGILRNESQVKFDVCTTFKFSPVDWTLYELQPYNENIESDYCRHLYKTIFEEMTLPFLKKEKRIHKRVKWIVHTNGTITNLGCTKHVRYCEPGSYFDEKRKMRIDTPPCCRQKMLEILQLISDELNKFNVKYAITGGFAMSYARKKDILHYDEDIDMFIEESFWRTPEFTRFFNQLTKEYGFFQHWRKYDMKAMDLWYSKLNQNRVAMWPYQKYGKNLKRVRIPTGTPDYDLDVLEPPQTVILSSIKTKMPHKVESYLDLTYGKNKWTHELDCKKKYYRKCV